MTIALVFVFALALPYGPSPQASMAPSAAPSAPASAAPSGAPSPVAAPTAPAAEDLAVTKRAKEWFHRMQTGTVDRSQLDARMNAALSDDLVKQTSAKLAPLGTPTGFSYVKAVVVGNQIAYYYAVTVPTGTFYWLFGLDPDGKISGFYVRSQLPE
jgi:hypothetical protein